MFKLFRLLLLSISFVLGGTFCYLWIQRIPLAERFLSKSLNLQVSIENIDLKINGLKLDGVYVISNVSDSEEQPIKLTHMLRSPEVFIEINPLRFLIAANPRIESIIFINPVARIHLYNSSGSDNSWTDCITKIPNYSHSQGWPVRCLMLKNLKLELIKKDKTINAIAKSCLEFPLTATPDGIQFVSATKILFTSIMKTIEKETGYSSLTSSKAIQNIVKSSTIVPSSCTTEKRGENRSEFIFDILKILGTKSKQFTNYIISNFIINSNI